ncbi:senescence-associated carboxylesterase 101-like [Rosa rugosa]|uniref:senescence-associated carboxylesterase 101-like n=1 Tax=Rosa rugosa TaxID=74645 RepID=UPI002B4043AE|nr:senescence-associated carboxylesterase 101-like [Rosa rugosa]
MSNNQFSSGLESANFVLTSDPVHQAWNAIGKQKQINPNAEPSLFNEIQPENPTIIAFGTPPSSLQGQEGLVSSSNLKEDNFDHFEFLCNKSNPNFSLNQAAIELFKSQYHELLRLKEKLVGNSKSKTPSLVIITGQSVGGSVATLFTLWLLQGFNLSRANKRPLCVTFGSPLVGDEHLRQCVLQFSTLKSCFLHVVSNQDPTPQLFISRNPGAYKPFGTFLLCSASGCACFEDPDIILEQLVKTNSQNQECHYGKILGDLKCKALCNVLKSTEAERDSLQASLITQLQAIEILSQKQPSTEIHNLIQRMKKHEATLLIQMKKNSNLESHEDLNEMKLLMAFLEWYKKEGIRRKTGDYDTYKNQWDPTDKKNVEYKEKLMNYWEDIVTEVENRPQIEGAHFRVRFLYAGTTYRRLLEPLHIAEYYKDGGKNYQTEEGKRPKHFILLEEWLKKVVKPKATPSKSKKENAGSNLNEDSCFWAYVEEALISCNTLKDEESSSEERESSLQKLKEFEGYVLDSLKNYAVNPEIFLEQSSFMQWWNKYQVIMGSYYSSSLTKLMKNGTYLLFNEGRLDL